MGKAVECVRCALCASEVVEGLMRVPDIKRGTRNAFHLVRCHGCGLVYLNPRPTVAEMQSYYDATYGPHAAVYARASERNAADDRYYRGRVEKLLECLPQGFGCGRLLDVGSGDGYWLSLMQTRGWQVAGVEISPQAAVFARERFGLDVRTGELDAQGFPGESFDLLTFWHSLEHMHKPRVMLQEAYRILRWGGVVGIQVPNIDTILFQIFGRHYSMIEAPYHLYHFSPATLEALLAESGFEVYRTVHSPGTDGIAVSLKNVWLGIRIVSPRRTGECRSPARASPNNDGGAVIWLKRKVALPMLKPLGRLLAAIGQGDVFSVYARRR